MIGRNTFKWQCWENSPTGISGFIRLNQLFVLAGSKCDVVSLPYDSRNKLELSCDSGPWPKRHRQNHCSSFRTFTFLTFEGQKNNFYSRGTKESFVSILARQTVPIGLDDPQSVKNISEVLINLPLPRCKKHKREKRCQ